MFYARAVAEVGERYGLAPGQRRKPQVGTGDYSECGDGTDMSYYVAPSGLRREYDSRRRQKSCAFASEPAWSMTGPRSLAPWHSSEPLGRRRRHPRFDQRVPEASGKGSRVPACASDGSTIPAITSYAVRLWPAVSCPS